MRFIILSALTHLILLLPFLLGTAGSGGGDDGINDVTVTPRRDVVEVTTVSSTELGGIGKLSVDVDKECPNAWFGGIGITSSSGLITWVYDGYPASNAGLLVGDKILGSGGERITGTPGTVLSLTVLRNNQVITFSITRGRICYDPK